MARVKSRRSGPQGNCYQIERLSLNRFDLTDSKQNHLGPEQPSIKFTLDGWRDVLEKLRDGYLGLGISTTLVGVPVIFEETIVERTGPNEFVWRSRDDSNPTLLKFTLAEHDAFLMGVNDDEFDPSEDDGPIYLADIVRHRGDLQPDMSEGSIG